MNILERLLQGIQAKQELERKAQEFEAEKAEREAKAVIARKVNSVREESAKESERNREIIETLERLSVRERLEAIRDGVWKVGNIYPIDEAYRQEGDHPTGYQLVSHYPAAIPILEKVRYTIMTQPSYASGHGGGPFSYTGLGRTGFSIEGYRYDAVTIMVQAGKHTPYSGETFVRLEAVSGLNSKDSYQKAEHLLYEGWSWEYMNLTPGGDTTHALKNTDISTPHFLEMLLTNYSHDIFKENRLPLQNEATAQKQLVVVREAGRIKG